MKALLKSLSPALVFTDEEIKDELSLHDKTGKKTL